MSPLAAPETPIAILGAGCVLPPTSTSLVEYRRNLLAGTPGISPIPAKRWDRDRYFSKDRHAPERTYCTLGGFVDDYHGDFTPYGLTAAQARVVAEANRTQLFAIDAALQALQAAGYDTARRSTIRGAIYLGNMLGDETLTNYSMRRRAEDHHERLAACLGTPQGTTAAAWRDAWAQASDRQFGSSQPAPQHVLASALAPVVAAALGLSGEATLVDGACASGLLVVDAAIAALVRGDRDLVVAIGTMANMGVAGNVSFAKIGGLSPDGSRPLSASANGLIPGEGSGAVVLKRLDRALAEGDPIIGVIRGAATRSDGAGKAIYAPSSRGQVAAMQAALDQAGLSARDLDYVEVHATGTPTGDTTELESVALLVSHARRTDPVTIGSGKALVGHGFPSAGIANLVKVLLSFQEQRFFPTFGVDQPTSALAERAESLRLLPEGGPWPRHPDHPRRALANAFGFGGVDSSVLVEEFDSDYHRALLGSAPATPKPQQVTSWLAVVGASALLPGLPAASGLPDAVAFQQAWDDLAAHPTGLADDFRFPFREVKIPPSTLRQTDRAQQLFLSTSLHALQHAGLLTGRTVSIPERVATVVATASGSQASLDRNERIRADEFVDVLESAARLCSVSTEAITGWRAGLQDAFPVGPDTTTEAALPGYMDNIVAGRVGNILDLRGTNYIVDADLSSWGAAVWAATGILDEAQADAVVIGGVNALVAPEMADLWSRQVGAPLRPVEGSVSFVVRRAEDISPHDHVLGYVRAAPDATGTGTGLAAGEVTTLGADGAFWALTRLLALASDPAATELTAALPSVFHGAGYTVTVARHPNAAPPEVAAPDLGHPVILEGADLNDLLAHLRAATPATTTTSASEGALRLVFDLDGDPTTRLQQVIAALVVASAPSAQ